MRLLLSSANVFQQGEFKVMDVVVNGGVVSEIAAFIDPVGFDRIIDLSEQLLIPGFVDVHVHLREPGFSYKETIKTGTLAAARGGYTAVCAMPNLNPAPDSVPHLTEQIALTERDAAVKVYPYGTITIGQKGEGELADIEGMRPMVCGYSDDGRGVQDEDTMRRAMLRVKEIDGLIAAHCEDNAELLPGGAVHQGVAADKYGLVGISSKSEWAQIERDIELARQTGCKYHVCHISTKESVDLIRKAKALGIDVSCETAPHYLLLADEDLLDEGRFKMNPPIRSSKDRDALIEGLLDGTIDMIATDHAPHSAEEKSKGLKNSVMGIVGLESAFALMHTHFVKKGILSMERLIHLMSLAPRRRFHLPGGDIQVGAPADLVALDTACEYGIDPDDFLSMGHSTPFEGWTVQGRATLTIVDGHIQYEQGGIS